MRRFENPLFPPLANPRVIFREPRRHRRGAFFRTPRAVPRRHRLAPRGAFSTTRRGSGSGAGSCPCRCCFGFHLSTGSRARSPCSRKTRRPSRTGNSSRRAMKSGGSSQLFDPFFRPDTARAHETGGTGLGRAIVKSCIEACGGSVAAKKSRAARSESGTAAQRSGRYVSPRGGDIPVAAPTPARSAKLPARANSIWRCARWFSVGDRNVVASWIHFQSHSPFSGVIESGTRDSRRGSSEPNR